MQQGHSDLQNVLSNQENSQKVLSSAESLSSQLSFLITDTIPNIKMEINNTLIKVATDSAIATKDIMASEKRTELESYLRDAQKISEISQSSYALYEKILNFDIDKENFYSQMIAEKDQKHQDEIKKINSEYEHRLNLEIQNISDRIRTECGQEMASKEGYYLEQIRTHERAFALYKNKTNGAFEEEVNLILKS